MNQKNSMTEKWTEVISPKRSLLDINLKEIWRYRDLIMLFVRRDFVSQYKQTILGITLWNYFSDCFNKTSNTFVANAGIFGKVYFPRLATPISIVFSNLIKLGIQVLLFVAIMVYQMIFNKVQINVNLYILVLPYLILLMAVMGLGLGIIFSALTTKYRDLSFLLTFGIQLLMYATPIIYPLSFTSGKLHSLISMNPLTPIMESFRYAFFSIGTFDWSGLAFTSIFSFSVLFIGIIIFNQVEKSFMDTV
jgi:lipopolysaccharide transport system permease protein